MSMKYIRDTYRVPAKKGGKVKFQGKPGIITGANGGYLNILLDGESLPLPCHPTWKIEYLPEQS